MDIKEFEARLEPTNDGKFVIFRGSAEELANVRNNVSLQMWHEMTSDVSLVHVEGAIAVYGDVVLVEKEPGSFAKGMRPFLASLI